MGELAPGLRRCRLAVPDSRWLLIDAGFCLERLTEAFQLGFDGHEVGTPSRDGLVAAARLLAAGGKAFSVELVRLPCRPPPALRLAAVAGRADGLMPCERAVADCLGPGLADMEIATALGLSQTTVATHLKAIRRRLDLANRTQIALWTARAGHHAAKSRAAGV